MGLAEFWVLEHGSSKAEQEPLCIRRSRCGISLTLLSMRSKVSME